MTDMTDNAKSADELKQFMARILAITPQYSDVFGNGVPGMAGRSAATSGAANAGADVTNKLHHTAIDFARAYADPKSSLAAVQQLSGEVEGLLMVAVTLGVVSEKDSQLHLDSLDNLLANR